MHDYQHTQKETAATLSTLAQQSAHKVTIAGDRYTCEYCQNSYSSKDELSLQQWLLTPCNILPATARPCDISANRLHIGNLIIHPTHAKRVHRGLVFCRKCGSRAGSCLKNLASPCVPPGRYGKESLKAILNDSLPPNLVAWPLPG